MQDLLKSYKQFTTSYYLTDGLRITLAIMLPIIICSMTDNVRAGVTMALGALCVSLCDSPGPLHHRINGMLSAITLVFIITLITGFSVHYYWLIALELFLFSFIFSMIGIYGARATSVGIAGLLIMILHIDEDYTFKEVMLNSIFILVGGAWYFLLSLGLNKLRPYKLAQQAIGDAILSTAKYMQLKALMYEPQINYDENYRNLIARQITTHTKQNLVREILFKTRNIVKDSTHKGRTLLAIFNDAVDLFEQIMSTHFNYKALHECVDGEMLSSFKETISIVASELERIGIAMQRGNKSIPYESTAVAIEELKQHYTNYLLRYMNEHNKEVLQSMQLVIENIQFIYDRILIMHRYTAYDPEFTAAVASDHDYNKFISTTDISVETFFSNLNMQSNIFRYSLRVSLTILIGYLSLRFLPFGHNYWILLTILVILKPAYSLTKKRNIQRLTGTLIGIGIGAGILYFIKDEILLLTIMILSMIAAYSLMRIQYLPFVILMTVYLLISFYLLKTNDFNKLIIDRIIDTGIGSALAFFATFLLPPKWEKEQIGALIEDSVVANGQYFKYVANVFVTQQKDVIHYKLLRKEAYVSLANLSDAFQRMLSEPEDKQVKGAEVYTMVVSNHLLLSHISTLASYLPKMDHAITQQAFSEIVHNTLLMLQKEYPAINHTFILGEAMTSLQKRERVVGMNEKQTIDMSVPITEQLGYIHKIAREIYRIRIKRLQAETVSAG